MHQNTAYMQTSVLHLRGIKIRRSDTGRAFAGLLFFLLYSYIRGYYLGLLYIIIHESCKCV